MKHVTRLVVAVVGSFLVAFDGSAGFIGVHVNEYVNPTAEGTFLVADVYMAFDTTDEMLLGVVAEQTIIEGGFAQLNHKNLVPVDSWSPQFTTPGFASSDSFVTIGGMPGFGNSTQSGHWGGAGFNQTNIPAGAWWYNSNPSNLQGLAQHVDLSNLAATAPYAGPATFVMRLVIGEALVGDTGLAFSFIGSLEFSHGLGTPDLSSEFAFSGQLWAVPAPGALALLGMAGVGGRRRRGA